MSQKVTKVTARQARAAQLLASGFSVQEAAKQLRVRRETVSRWQTRPAFAAEYARAVEAVEAALRERMVQLADKAMLALGDFYAYGSNWEKRSQLAFDVVKFLAAARVWTPPGNTINNQ